MVGLAGFRHREREVGILEPDALTRRGPVDAPKDRHDDGGRDGQGGEQHQVGRWAGHGGIVKPDG